jgi:hypothetical protein
MTDPITPRTHPNLPASTPAAPIMARSTARQATIAQIAMSHRA